MNWGLFRSRNNAVSAVLRYRASGPSPSRSRKLRARSVSKKSGFARGCKPRASCSSRPVMALAPSFVNSPTSSAESRTFAGQKARPTSMIRAGDNVFIADKLLIVYVNRLQGFPAVKCRFNSCRVARREVITLHDRAIALLYSSNRVCWHPFLPSRQLIDTTGVTNCRLVSSSN